MAAMDGVARERAEPGRAAPAITVVLPVRNGAPFLRAALDSLRSQTVPDFEVLVLDDGSTDDTAAIALGLGDERIRVLSDGRALGLAPRLNQGVALARGEFIARMDADDVSFPRRLERQLAFLRANPEVDLVGCRAVVFRGAGEMLGLLPFEPTHERLCARPWHTIPLPHPTWFGRRAWFLRHPYRAPEVVRAEDQELLLRASRDSRYACLPEILLGYRQSGFAFGRTWAARKSLLAAQARIFRERAEWGNLMLAGAAATLKVARDAAATLPGATALRDVALGPDVDAATRHDLLASLAPVPGSAG